MLIVICELAVAVSLDAFDVIILWFGVVPKTVDCII